jgi:hypothetical protein
MQRHSFLSRRFIQYRALILRNMMRMRAKRLGEGIVRLKRRRNKFGQQGISWKVEHWSEGIVCLVEFLSDLARLMISDCERWTTRWEQSGQWQ